MKTLRFLIVSLVTFCQLVGAAPAAEVLWVGDGQQLHSFSSRADLIERVPRSLLSQPRIVYVQTKDRKGKLTLRPVAKVELVEAVFEGTEPFPFLEEVPTLAERRARRNSCLGWAIAASFATTVVLVTWLLPPNTKLGNPLGNGNFDNFVSTDIGPPQIVAEFSAAPPPKPVEGNDNVNESPETPPAPSEVAETAPTPAEEEKPKAEVAQVPPETKEEPPPPPAAEPMPAPVTPSVVANETPKTEAAPAPAPAPDPTAGTETKVIETVQPGKKRRILFVEKTESSKVGSGSFPDASADVEVLFKDQVRRRIANLIGAYSEAKGNLLPKVRCIGPEGTRVDLSAVKEPVYTEFLAVFGTDGKVEEFHILHPSGYPELDQMIEKIVREKWSLTERLASDSPIADRILKQSFYWANPPPNTFQLHSDRYLERDFNQSK